MFHIALLIIAYVGTYFIEIKTYLLKTEHDTIYHVRYMFWKTGVVMILLND